MAKGSIDRRVARTRAALQQACMSLVLKKGHDAVTVSDICKTANIGRSTFYSHFAGKDDIRRVGLEDLRKQLLAHQRHAQAHPVGSKHKLFSFVRPMLQHASEHLNMYRAVAGGRGGTAALVQIHKIIADLVRNELASIHTSELDTTVPDELIVQYLAGAFVSLMTWWLDDGAKLPLDRVDETFRRLALEGFASVRML
jgi:AcrR family transcriptional regulator